MGLRLVLMLTLLSVALGLNLGTGPTYYKEGQKVDLIVNKIESDHTELPFSYHSLPFICPLPKDSEPVSLSLGEILRGDRKWKSNYRLNFGIDLPCVRLCDLICTDAIVNNADKLIREGYVVHWEVDNLPGATTFETNQKNKYYAAGFPLGFVEDDVSYIYNHVMLVIRIHRADHNPNLHTIVGFEVYPKSVSNEQCPNQSTDFQNFALISPNTPMSPTEKSKIPYTYSVYWREDNSVDYENRWDLYYYNDIDESRNHVQWLSVMNSFLVVFVISVLVAFIIANMVKKDLKNDDDILPSNTNEKRWKLLSNHVLGKPSLSLLLSVVTATGVQMIVCTFGVLFIFVLSTKFSLNSTQIFDNNKGAFFSFSIFFLVCSGMVSSYFGIIFHKIVSNNPVSEKYNMKTLIILSILFSGSLPLIVLSVVLFLNFFVWAKKSSNALPFGSIILLILFLLLIVIPLGIIGGSYGNLKQFESKSFFTLNRGGGDKTNSRVRRRFTWITNPGLSTVIFGLIPFGVVYVELQFIFNSVWLEKTTFYHMYGFLMIATSMLTVIISEFTIIAIYTSLAIYNDPNWHWLSFNVGSSIGWYIFAYSTYYFVQVLQIRDLVSTLFFFAYMGLASVLIGAAGGAVGVITGLIFIRKIYGDVKLD